MCRKYYRFSSKKSCEKFINEGVIYFNSLSYYKNYKGENYAIKDEKEGSIENNISKNNHEITFDGYTFKPEDIASETINIKNELREPENFFIFCLANKFNNNLYEEFEADACVEIKDIKEFSNRIKKILPDNYKLNFDDVEYYDNEKPKTATKPLCLYKEIAYAYQNESRFYIYIPYLENSKCNANACNIGQIDNFIVYLKFQCLELRIGDLSDICHIINKDSNFVKQQKREK